jgi:hypothetical protein
MKSYISLEEGLSYANTSEYSGYLYKTIKCIVKVLKENVQFVPNHRGNVCYLILQDEHIHWWVEWLVVDPNVTVESLHRQLNDIFQFHVLYLSLVFQKSFRDMLDLPSSWCAMNQIIITMKNVLESI